MMTNVDPNRTARLAGEIRKRCEDSLDEMARIHVAKHGGDFYDAYAAVCDTPKGRSILADRETAYQIQVGQPT
jgi:hypothetical protein